MMNNSRGKRGASNGNAPSNRKYNQPQQYHQRNEDNYHEETYYFPGAASLSDHIDGINT